MSEAARDRFELLQHKEGKKKKIKERNNWKNSKLLAKYAVRSWCFLSNCSLQLVTACSQNRLGHCPNLLEIGGRFDVDLMLIMFQHSEKCQMEENSSQLPWKRAQLRHSWSPLARSLSYSHFLKAKMKVTSILHCKAIFKTKPINARNQYSKGRGLGAQDRSVWMVLLGNQPPHLHSAAQTRVCKAARSQCRVLISLSDTSGSRSSNFTLANPKILREVCFGEKKNDICIRVEIGARSLANSHWLQGGWDLSDYFSSWVFLDQESLWTWTGSSSVFLRPVAAVNTMHFHSLCRWCWEPQQLSYNF